MGPNAGQHSSVVPWPILHPPPPDVVRSTLDALGRKTDRESAAAKTALRKRSAFSEVLGTAVDKGYFAESPLARLKWQAPGVSEKVDPACVPNPTQVARLLTAVGRQQGRGPHLEAFFGCMYYAAMAKTHRSLRRGARWPSVSQCGRRLR